MNAQSDCFPYKRKKFYTALTVPFMIVILAVLLFLWNVNPLYGVIYLWFYLQACIFQSYCCHYQDCPYRGKFCPAVVGIVPASWIATMPLVRNIRKSETLFNISATLGSLGLAGMIVFPLLFLGVTLSVSYLIIIVIYAALFLWFICPVCCIKHTCPGGRASSAIRREK